MGLGSRMPILCEIGKKKNCICLSTCFFVCVCNCKTMERLLGVTKPAVKQKEWRTESREQPEVSLFRCELTLGDCCEKTEAVFKAQQRKDNESYRRQLYTEKQSKREGR